jgi:hypothetical protein
MKSDLVIRKVIEKFCIEFLNSPYLCYTEHGLHARFYCLLYNTFPIDQRYVKFDGKEICAIQKEYPTADVLGKPQRQHWDIAIIQSPPSPQFGKSPPYDYLNLNSVVEFGLNATKDHLVDDIERLCHHNSNVKNKFIVHLYRLSKPKVSGRDLSPDSAQLLSLEDMSRLVRDKEVEVYFGRYDNTGRFQSGVWRLNKNEISVLRVFRAKVFSYEIQ